MNENGKEIKELGNKFKDKAKNEAKKLKDKKKKELKLGFKQLLIISSIKLVILAIIFFLVFSIISSFIYIADEEGFSRTTEKAVENVIEEKVDIAEGANGSYFKIDKTFVDKFIEELNKAYFNGYFFEEEPSEREDDFVYDSENADIKEEELAAWFRTDDYKKYLIKMIKAQMASSYPKLSNYQGEEGQEDECGNRVDANGDYVVQGIVQIKRTTMNQDGTVNDEADLDYIDYDKLKELIDANDSKALKYFSFKEENGMIYYATYRETVVTENGTETDRVYVLSENCISYKTAVSTCSMPYNFLFNLLQVSKNPEYVMAVIDLLLEDSEIVLMIQDQMNITTQTHVETYYHAKKTEEEQYRKEESPTGDFWDYTGTRTTYDYPSGSANIITTITKTYTNTATTFIQRAHTWCMDYEQEAVENNTNTPGEAVVVEESYDEEALEGLSYTETSSYTKKKGSRKSEFTIYTSDNELLYSTSDKLDTEVFGWTTSTSTEKTVNYEKFLGLWKNTDGEYSIGALYDPNGKLVKYNLPDQKGSSYPARDIPNANGQNIDDLVDLLAKHSNTQMHEQLMMYYWNIYFGKDVYEVELENIIKLFNTDTFTSMGGFGFGSVSYESLKDQITEKDIEYIARITYAERGDGNQEQQGYVVSVILNRVLSSKWPNTVFGVISKNKEFASYQNSRYNSDGYLNETTQAAVRSVIENGDTTGGAVYFMTPPAADKLDKSGEGWFKPLQFMFNDVTGTEAPVPGGPGWEKTHNFYTTEEVLAELKPSGGNETIVELARSKLGCPYVWAAHGPDSFDCSGLVEWIYRQQGIKVPWCTADYKQYAGSEHEISFEEAKPRRYFIDIFMGTWQK